MFKDIPNSENWKIIKKINAGWSNDTKYHIIDNSEEEYLLRISNNQNYEVKLKQYKRLTKLNDLDLNIQKVVSFGKLSNEQKQIGDAVYQDVYTLFTYLKGIDPKDVIKNLSEIEQYELGISAGKILKVIHNLEIDNNNIWWENYQIKIKRKIDGFKNLNYALPHTETLLQFINDNLEIVKNRPLCLCHGDYHLGNMVINNFKIGIIDFDKFTLADPYDDFKPFCWNVEISPYFETGLIDGYFNKLIPNDFFNILSLYAAESLISQLPWAIKFGENEIKTAIKVYNDVLGYYHNFSKIIPSWYKKP